MNNYRKTIYDIFRTKISGGKDALNEIVKGTKSVLASKNGYQSYIKNYFSSTKLASFKTPDITEYPLLKTESYYLIPIRATKFKEKERESKKYKKPNLILDTEIFGNDKKNIYVDFNKRLEKLLLYNKETRKALSYKTKNYNYEKNKRYNSLFLDFFNKWNAYDNNLSSKNLFEKENTKEKKVNEKSILPNFNIKERYNGLYYNENEIFNTNYNKFLFNKINYIKLNRIKNFTNEIKSSFNDSNEKKIKLKLESIKLTFTPRLKKQKDYDELQVFIPLSYVFLFYYGDFAFFQKILMSLLKFDMNFKKINFQDDELPNLLNSLGNNGKNKDIDNNDILANFKKPNYSENINNNSPFKPELTDKDLRKTYNRNNFLLNKFMRKTSSIIEEETKIKVIHSNRKLNKVNIIKEENNDDEKTIDNIINDNNNEYINIYYDEYYFIWETSAITYDVKMEMPKIYFSYENLNYKIISFCDKNLFLYLYKNNFINWDFYALNYLFSFKYFRKIILNFFSLKKSDILIDNHLFTNLRSIKINNTNTRYNNNLKIVDDDKSNEENEEEEEEKDIIISNKKILNQMSENNESYVFFYTDQNYYNYIINLYSYKILITYKKLNPKLKWEFYLNFRQMKNLNEVSKYEDLITFLPKIIVTNFEIGELDINFQVFDHNFNAKILENESGHNTSTKKHLKVEVFKPYVQTEIIGGKDEKKSKKELNFILLQNLNELQMTNWSRKILSIMKKDIFHKSYRASEINFNRFEFLKTNQEPNEIVRKNSKNSKKKMTFIMRSPLKKLDI